MAVNIASGLVELIDYSALCAGRDEGTLKAQLDPRVGYLFAKRTGRIGWQGLKRIHLFIKEHGITHIHAHSTSIYAASLLKIRNPGCKLVWHDHYGKAEFLQNRPKELLKLMRSTIDTVISVNQSLQQWAIENRFGKQQHYLPNFANLPIASTISSPIPGTPGKRVICLANLRPQKNHELLLGAWTRIQDRFPEWHLLIVGGGFDDAHENRINQLVEQNEHKLRIHLMGSRTEILPLLQECAIGVLSSKSEGLPVALLEYGLAGLPVVVTDVGACREALGDQGMVVPPTDEPAFAEALASLMENTNERQRLGEGWKKRVENTYGSDTYFERLLMIYQQVYD